MGDQVTDFNFRMTLFKLKWILFAICKISTYSNATNLGYEGSIRLTGGCDTAGRVEVYINGTWGTVCADQWNLTDAEVVCHQLGFASAVSAPANATFGEGRGSIHLNNVGCYGDESNLTDCLHDADTSDCRHHDDAGVVCSPFSAPGEGSIRLTGGNDTAGRVEIYINGKWGTVCDDRWNVTDAEVVCRQLGFASAVSAPLNATFGDGEGSIHMDDVECYGNESRLTDCSYDGETSDCRHFEDAGVVCSSFPVPGESSIRLTGGCDTAGRVEVYINGEWGTVCDDKWDVTDAEVVCHQLGFASAVSAPGNATFGEGTGSIHLVNVICFGGENNLATECLNDGDTSDCSHSEDAGVVCSPFSAPDEGSIRLSGGNNTAGTVQVYINGTWGTICYIGWNVPDAEVVCRQLGFIAGVPTWGVSFGRTEGTIHMDTVRCHGDENRLIDCIYGPKSWYCNHSFDAGVVCFSAPVPAEGSIRLTGGNNTAGRVEVYVNETWGTVCDNGWDMTDAEVVCHQLGFILAVPALLNATFGEGEGSIHLDDVECYGHESRLVDCSYDTDTSDCRHSEDIGVICSSAPVPAEGSVRLAGGNDTAGRIEVYINGVWGTVCDDGWDVTDAEVVCRQLGFASAVSAPLNATFGVGVGSIYLDEVGCYGDERKLTDCFYDFDTSDCSHYEDAGVVCSSVSVPGDEDDVLSLFHRYPGSYYHNKAYRHESFGIGYDGFTTAEKCAINCLQATFVCLSFVFQRRGSSCIWSAASPNVDGALAELPQHPNYDLFVRIDTECHPLRVTSLPDGCNLPVTIMSNSTKKEAMRDTNLFKYSKFGLNECWQPESMNEFLTIPLADRYVISAIVVHGCDNEDLGWVKTFTVMESVNKYPIERYVAGNVEARCPSLVTLKNPIHTDVITIKPESYYIGIAMKVDLLGCLDNDCDEDVGVISNALPDAAFSSSSGLNDPSEVRYRPFDILQDETEGWIADTSMESNWIQIMLPSLYVVRGIVVVGCKEPYPWVTSFKVAFSAQTVTLSSNVELSWILEDQNGEDAKIFSADIDRVAPKRIDFDEDLLATTLRLHLLPLNGQTCLKLAVIGCRYRSCFRRLGMISGDITSDQIFKSYRRNICYQGGESRLFGSPSFYLQGASTTATEQDQDIIVDLREVHVITAIATQGTYDLDDHFISTFPTYYIFQFRENSSGEWKTYLDIDGSTKVFGSADDPTSVGINYLERPVRASHIRLVYGRVASTGKYDTCLRMELFGCKLTERGNVCESAGLEISGNCFGAVQSRSETACQDIFQSSSHPAIINSEKLRNDLYNDFKHLQLESYDYYLIGLKLGNATDEILDGRELLYWYDGTPATYTDFRSDIEMPDEHSHFSSLCVYLSTRDSFTWILEPCSSLQITPATLCQMDIDECLQWNKPCSHLCVNHPGSYHCACPDGYYINPDDEHSCLSLCDFVDNYDAVKEGENCVRVVSTPVTWPDAVQTCTDEGGVMLMSHKTSFLQGDNRFMDLVASGIWINATFIRVWNDTCHVLSIDEAKIVSPVNCHSVHQFICTRGYPKTFEIDGGCVEERRLAQEQCPIENYYSDKGYLTWNALPPFYKSSTSTIFHLLAMPGEKIRINFLHVNIRMDNKQSICIDKLVVVANVPNSNYLRKEYCGKFQDVELQLEASYATLTLEMNSLAAQTPQKLSFQAYFHGLNCSLVDCTTDCPSEPYTDSSGEIKTPNFPAALSYFFTCTWDIIVSNGQYIRLDFLSVVVICQMTDNLVVYDLGDDGNSLPSVPKLEICGKEHISIVSSGRQLRIKLVNGIHRFSQGFHASYYNTDVPGCGFFSPITARGSFSCDLPRAVIANSDYPNWHPKQGPTSWIITTSPGTYIALNFTLFNVQSSIRNCKYSYLKIASNETSNVLCNTNFLSYAPDGVYYSHRNSLIVEMAVEDDSNATFIATYSEMNFVAKELRDNGDAFCPTGWILSGNNCYRLYQGKQLLSWWDAQEKCKDWYQEAFLVAIHSQLEMNFLQRLILNSSTSITGVYIGLLWRNVERDFRWENGQPVTFTDWTIARGYTSKQPDSGGLEGCGIIDFWSYRVTSNWQDIPCSKKITGQFVCQQRAQSNSDAENVTSAFEKVILKYTGDDNQVCNEHHFRCSSGECILEVYHCDIHRDCSDGSDEEACVSNENGCQPTDYECDDGTCVSATFFCDSVPHCRDGSDEYDCDRPNCTNGERRCSQNGRCISFELFCDLKDDCLDGSDELQCTNSKGNFRCFSNHLIPANRVCDGFRDCEGKNWEDESESCDYLQDPLLCNKTSRFQCRSGACADPSTLCLHEMDEYNYQKGCRDGSHLRDCESFQCPVGYFKCPDSYCIPERYRCNAVMDCPLGEDEIRCGHYICSPASYNCHNSHVCLHQHRICDGHLDCIEGDDELFCDVVCFEGCSCRGLSLTCASSIWQLDYVQSLSHDLRQLVLTGVQPLGERNTRSLERNTSDQLSISTIFDIKLKDFPYLFHLDLSSNGIEIILPKEFIRNTNLRTLILSHNQIYTIWSESFTGLQRLQYLNLSGNPLTQLSQQPFSGLFHLRTLDIQATNIQSMGKDLFNGLSSLKNLYSDRFFFCCLAEFVVKIDKCIPDAGQFSSCQDLMKNRFLLVCLWILGLAAVLGNCGVIFWRIYKKEIIRTDRHNPTQAILILNLAIADLLLGVYMLIIAIADLSFRSVYYRYSEIWQTSNLCKLAGFLSVLGSEASVMFLAVITLDRFHGVAFPLSSKRLKVGSTVAVCCVVWFIAFCFSAIPLIPFDYFGVSYYGRSSVCLALPLTKDFSPGWLYSVLVFLVFNCICFLVMFLCYSFIYIRASRSVAFQRSMRQIEQRNKIEEQLQLASKMAFLVVTDMLCWLPIILMGFLSQVGGIEIPSIIYAWTAVFIMPVNSAMNPYLYTAFVNASKRKTTRPSFMTQSSLMESDRPSSTYTSMQLATNDKIMKIMCTEFKRYRIILAMTSLMEKYSLTKFRTNESFNLTENNKLDISADIRKAVAFLHDEGFVHGQLKENYVIVEEFPNGEKRAFLLLPLRLLVGYALQGESDREQQAATREKDIEDLEELVKRLDVMDSIATL